MAIIDMDKIGEALNTKADVDLNNTGVFSTSGGGVNLISSTPANAIGKEVTSADFIKSDIQSNLLNYTTNRILEIPQDIKLEIVDGVLILRAGSKVCVPAGFEEDEQTRKFSFITTTRDLLYTEPLPTASLTLHLYAYYKNGEITGISRRGENNSGSTVPSDNYNGAFYNTTTNNVEQYKNGSLSDISSLPLGLVTSVAKEGNNITTIDQIFNGFGYIGKTIFLLPGVKFQTSQGKNPDGSIKTAIYTRSTVSISSLTFHTGHYYLMANDSVGYPFFIPKSQRFIQSYAPDTSNLVGINYWYNTSEERWYNLMTADKTWEYMPGVMDIFGEASATDGLLYDFKGYPLNHINTYQRTELAGMGMPSNRYINLTLGASGSTYTAPANGWFYFLGRWENAIPYFQMKNTTISDLEPRVQTCGASTTGYWGLYMPVRAGDRITIDYNDAPVNVRLAFIYAQGEQ